MGGWYNMIIAKTRWCVPQLQMAVCHGRVKHECLYQPHVWVWWFDQWLCVTWRHHLWPDSVFDRPPEFWCYEDPTNVFFPTIHDEFAFWNYFDTETHRKTICRP